jgi:hypothetical protein
MSSWLGALRAGEVEGGAAVVTGAQVDNWLRTWQKRLQLDDWRVTARIVRATELKPDTLGNLKWNLAERTAAIKVLDPVDYDLPAADVPEDMEYTIVHELVHLQLSVLPRDLSKRDIEETVVNRLAEALMALGRGGAYRVRNVPPPKRPGKANETQLAGRTAAK